MEQFLIQLRDYILSFAATAGTACGAIIVTLLFYFVASRGLAACHRHESLPTPMITAIRRMLRWLVMFGGTLLVLQAIGVLQSAVAALTGLLAMIAIGFVAVWSVLSNGLCSVILLVMRPFRVGDLIEFPPDELKGTVVNFNMLFTTLKTKDGGMLQIPNNMFFQRPIVRREGKSEVGLDEQLYRVEDARV